MMKLKQFLLALSLLFCARANAQLSLEDGAKYYLMSGDQYVYYNADWSMMDMTNDISSAAEFTIIYDGMGYVFNCQEGYLTIDDFDGLNVSSSQDWFDVEGTNEAFSLMYAFDYVVYGGYFYLDTAPSTTFKLVKVGGNTGSTTEYKFCRLLNGSGNVFKASPTMENQQLVSGGYNIEGNASLNETDYNNIWIAETTDGGATYKFKHANSGAYISNGKGGISLAQGGSDIVKAANLEYNGVTYNVSEIESINYTLNGSGYGTLCLPFDFETTGGLTANKVTLSGDAERLNVAAVEDTKKANEGYIMIGTPGTTYTINIADVAVEHNDNLLDGTCCREQGFSAGYFYGLLTNAETKSATLALSTISVVPANKAYLLENKLNSGVNSYTLNFETEGVSILNAVAAQNSMTDLSGRRVSAPVKGQIYIINGKKVVY